MAQPQQQPRHPFVVDVPPDLNPPTDFSKVVVHATAQMTGEGGTIDQERLRQCLGMASSYLVTDTSTNPDGFKTWSTGFCQLVDLMAVLHARGELDLETMNEASKACSECWGIAGAWRGLAFAKEGVRAVGLKLKRMLDENGQTYRGEPIYGAN